MVLQEALLAPMSLLLSMNSCLPYVSCSACDGAREAQPGKGLIDRHLGPIHNRLHTVNGWPHPQSKCLQSDRSQSVPFCTQVLLSSTWSASTVTEWSNRMQRSLAAVCGYLRSSCRMLVEVEINDVEHFLATAIHPPVMPVKWELIPKPAA